PAGFASLHELYLDNAPLDDYDLVCVHSLPALSRLFLSFTGISDEAIFHLVALRQTLTTLVIIGNPKITNDSIPALTLMDKLRVLCLEDTGVTMVGLRRLAAFISDRFDVTSEVAIDFSLSVPESCRAYLDDLPNMYLIDPPSPLISSPTACSDISVAALKRNLIQHTAVILKGTKAELRRKLDKFLELREADLRVRDLIGCVAEVELEEQEEGELEGDEENDEDDGEERYSQGDSEEDDGSQEV
ncbi:uncharacterized protein STEHIDRAFT_48393, partial [Stereum hirsutum FP-91666 SS1]|uniref:uncharacterized protein n=1 Tax=Stereum hirsutum (strain FP-91666) TaxID=721885 RepID=UPI000440C66B